MTLLLRILTSICLVFVLSTAADSAHQKRGQDPASSAGYELLQNSCTFGDLDIVFTDKAYRMSVPKFGVSAMMRAPKWELFVYNNINKKYSQMTQDEFFQFFRAHRGRCRFQEADLKKGVPDTIHGIRTISYAWGTARSVLHPDMKAGKEEKKKKPSKLPEGDQGERFWVAREIKLPPPAVHFFGNLMGVPELQFLLLRWVKFNSDGTRTMTIDTLKVTKRAIAKSVFEGPKGYVKAENPMAVLLTDMDADVPMDMFGGKQALPQGKPADMYRKLK